MKRTGITKKIQAALMLLACPFAAFASQDGGEDYHPFVVEGKIWYCTEENDAGDSFKLDYMISGDTIINGYACKKLLSRRERGRKDFNWYFECGLMEQGKRVFKVYKDRIITLYDFSMEVGDFFDYKNYRALVESIETWVTPQGREYKMWIIKAIESDRHGFFYYDVWIERIGGYSKPFRPFYEVFADSSFGVGVDRCIENGEILYDSGEANGVPSATVQDRQDAPCFDLQGRRLNGVPQRGMYIRDGRKYVVK